MCVSHVTYMLYVFAMLCTCCSFLQCTFFPFLQNVHVRTWSRTLCTCNVHAANVHVPVPAPASVPGPGPAPVPVPVSAFVPVSMNVYLVRVPACKRRCWCKHSRLPRTGVGYTAIRDREQHTHAPTHTP